MQLKVNLNIASIEQLKRWVNGVTKLVAEFSERKGRPLFRRRHEQPSQSQIQECKKQWVSGEKRQRCGGGKFQPEHRRRWPRWVWLNEFAGESCARKWTAQVHIIARIYGIRGNYLQCWWLATLITTIYYNLG